MKYAHSGMMLARELEVLDKDVSVSICTPKIPYGLSWDRNWASEATDR